ncbi:MAG: efflux RND transporter periplasmic adaptor subunit [Opitutales bacterium]|nr:efflux RND transporter periplasmic adaptor subunit [Opitutales bacterium]
MKLRIFFALLTLLGIVLVLGLVYASNIRLLIQSGAAAGGPPPETVEIRSVQTDRWEEVIRTIGSVSAIQGTTLRAEADGRIEEILFTPGAPVEKGDILLRINADVEQAQLAMAEAAARLAGITVRRSRDLLERQTISQAELDAAEANYAQAQAQVANINAQIDQRIVRAPFSGVLGIQRLSVGQFLNRGQEIVSLQASHPLRVDFDLPQNQLFRVRQGMRVRITTDAWPDDTFEGVVTALEPEIRERSRTFAIQATVDNEDDKLKPGMFVRAELLPDEIRDIVMVPQTAIRFATFGNAVFVVQPSEEHAGMQRAHQRLVRLGETRGDFVEITEGLSGREEVVASGVFKLRDGSFVRHSDRGTVEPSLTPTPINR